MAHVRYRDSILRPPEAPQIIFRLFLRETSYWLVPYPPIDF
jgi:hypothetical protein